MAVTQYKVSSSSNVWRKGTQLRIRPTLQENPTFSCGTVITVPYIGEAQALDVIAYYGQPFWIRREPDGICRPALKIFMRR